MNRYDGHNADITLCFTGRYVLLDDMRELLLAAAKEQFIMSNSDEYIDSARFAFEHCGVQLLSLANKVGC